MIERVAVRSELRLVDLINKYMRDQLQEVKVVQFVFILRIYLIVHPVYHVEIRVVSVPKPQQDMHVLGHLPESQRLHYVV